MSCGQRSTLRQVSLTHEYAGRHPERPSHSDPDADVRRALDLVWLGAAESDRFRNTTFRVGAVVGRRYVVEQFVARGGMGEIYAAFDQVLSVRVALKTLLPVVADDPLCIRRLRRELRLGRRIAHPNVCRAFDVGVHDEDPRDVVHFFTMELVCGESLASRLKRHPLGLNESLQIAKQLLLGLEAVHGAGVLHRDVKSHNVLLDERGSTPRAVLADFGLARRLDTRHRAPGGPSSGSLAYMAPEQIAGRELSPATDLFAVGVILFEMCTGQLPFKRPGQRLSHSERELLSMVTAAAPLPAALCDFIARCLSQSPTARYASARAALTALAVLSAGG